MPTYAYRGDEGLIAAVEGRLADAGFTREGEVEVADIVLTYCTNMTSLEDLYFGDDGIVELMSSGSIAVDLSPATPSFAKEMSAVVTVNGMVMVVAPMMVGNKVSEDALSRENLSCVAAAEDDGVDAARAMLDALFSNVAAASDVAEAQLIRSVRTIRATAEMVAAAESFSLLEACPDVAFSDDLRKIAFGNDVDASSDARFMVEAMSGADFEGDYNVEMLMGELSAAITSADECGLIMPQVEAAFHLLELLAVVGGIDLSPAALALVYEGEGSEDAAKLGLDWHRMDAVYGSSEDDCGCDCGDDCDCGHDHESSVYEDFDITDDYADSDDEDDEFYLPFR